MDCDGCSPLIVLFELPFFGILGRAVAKDDVHGNARRRRRIRTGSNPTSVMSKTSCQKEVLSTPIYIDLITQYHLCCSFVVYEYNFVSDIISTSEVAKGNLYSFLTLEVSQLSKPRVLDFGTNFIP